MKILGYAAGIGLLGVVVWLLTLPKLPEGEILSNTGLHWHTDLSIKIKGENIEIPADIGIGAAHNPMHTHDNTGKIHMEYGGVVKKSDLLLSNFFTIWGKTLSDRCLLDKCDGPDGALTMLMDGATSTEYGNLSMRDGQKIELIFE